MRFCVQSSKESITSMYSNAGDASFSKYSVTGDIEFGLAYNYKQNMLEVHIVRCRGIAAVDTKRNSSDPSVSSAFFSKSHSQNDL